MPGQSNSVLKRVYRALLKQAVDFDKRPFLRYLICKHSPLLEQDLHSIVDAYLGGRDFYVPSPLLPQSVFEATRVACRFPPEGCGSIDSALLGLRYLSTLSSVAAKHASPEHERAICSPQAPAGDVQTVAAPVGGCVLLSHPMQTGYWARAAVLITSSGPAQGSSGLLLRPSKAADARPHQPRTGRVLIYPDGSTTFSEWSTDDEDSSDEESDSDSPTLEEAHARGWMGGPVKSISPMAYSLSPHAGRSCVLPEMPGFPGLYQGDSMQAKADSTLQEEAHQVSSCHNFRGESLWEPFQLEEEMAKGYWICVRPSGSYLHTLWTEQMHLVMTNITQDPKNRSIAEMLWRKIFSEAGPPVSDAQIVTSAMAEAVMAE